MVDVVDKDPILKDIQAVDPWGRELGSSSDKSQQLFFGELRQIQTGDELLLDFVVSVLEKLVYDFLSLKKRHPRL